MHSKFTPITLLVAMILLMAPVIAYDAYAKDKQLGLRTVVIDPGHGGHDPGGVSKDKKVYEKNLVLDIAKRFGKKINEKFPDVKVIYTRTTDVYVTLNERAAIANRNDADLFISVHTNASTSTAPFGTSVHVLGQSSNPNRDLYASNLDVCKRENSVILLEEDYTTNYQGFDPDSPESFIFFNLMRSSHFENSILFASEVDKHMRKSDFKISSYTGIHQDPFWVLWKTSMPAVLLEMGFITNAGDLKILTTESGREMIADKLLAAFADYKKYYDSSIDTKNNNLSKTQEETKCETYYGIQIFGLKKVIKAGDPAFKGLDTHIVKVDGSTINRYITGKYKTSKEAVAELDSVRKLFSDAYVVKVSDGKVVRVK